MIPRITRGSSAAAALAYDFGPGRREEHVEARTVAGTVPGDWRAQAALIDATVAAKPRVEKGIWRTSLRAAPQDRTLTDAEWGAIADRYIAEMGVSGHPWTATRHGDDHIHLTVSRVSWTGTVVPLHRDFPKAQAACRAIEAEHHLIDASQRYDKTRPQVVHGEREYAARRGLVPEREQLRELVGAVTSAAAGDVAQRVAAERAHLTSAVAQGRAPGQGQKQGHAGAAADLRGAFEARLEAAGVVYRANVASTGKVSGYSYGLAGHLDASGEQVFFKGSQLGKAHSWAATTKELEAGAARGVAQHLTRPQQVEQQVDQRAGRDAGTGRAAKGKPAPASMEVQLERVREARRQRAAALPEQPIEQSVERSVERGIEHGAGQSREVSSGLSDVQAFQQALQRFREQFGHSARQQPREQSDGQPGGQPNRQPGREPVQPAAPRQASPDHRPDHRPDQRPDQRPEQQGERPDKELISGAQRERLRAQHEAVKARTAELQRAARAAERSYDQAKQALTTAQHDLRAALDDRSVAGGWVAQARGEVTRATGELEVLRAQVAGRSWLGRARQQLAEDWGSVTNAVTGGRAGAPRGQVHAQVAAAQERLVVADEYLGGRQRVLESVETRVSAARGAVAQAESAVPATRLVADRAQVAYSQAVMRPTEYEQLTYREYLAANPEVARRRQEALDPTSAVNRARRRDRSPGPGRDPDRGRGFGR